MATRPQIVAIVNVTQDSFSDGGRFLAPEAAIAHAGALEAAGADILELGPASSHPDAARVPVAEQIARLRPVLEGLATSRLPVAVDATEPDVQRFAMAAGVSILNDVRGFPEPSLYDELAQARTTLVVMHSLHAADRATREAATPREVLSSIDRFFDARLAALLRAGIAESRLVIDPGMGFFLGSDPQASVAVLQRIPELRARFGRPVLISVSRKSFLRTITGRAIAEIGAATLAAELQAARDGADYLRTHDVAALHDGLAVRERIGTPIELG